MTIDHRAAPPDMRSLSQKIYDGLPEAIKDQYTYEQWMWLSDAQKARLESVSTEPEWNE